MTTKDITVLREALTEIITNHGNWNNGMWAANVARTALSATERAAIQPEGERYTYKGTGFPYEHVAVAQGAGPLRGSLYHVYRDAGGHHYVRTPLDFDTRMQKAAPQEAKAEQVGSIEDDPKFQTAVSDLAVAAYNRQDCSPLKPWELKNVFNTSVFATTHGTEVRELFAKRAGSAAP